MDDRRKAFIIRTYLTSTVTDYVAVSIMISLVLLLLTKTSGQDIKHGILSIMTFILFNTALYTGKLTVYLAKCLLCMKYTGCVTDIRETKSGKYELIMKKDEHDKMAKESFAIPVPKSIYSLFLKNDKIRYMKVFKKRQLFLL